MLTVIRILMSIDSFFYSSLELKVKVPSKSLEFLLNLVHTKVTRKCNKSLTNSNPAFSTVAN